MRPYVFNIYSTVLSILSLLLAGVSIAISCFTYNNTIDQFKILNQGYLKVEPQIGFQGSSTAQFSKSRYEDSDEIISLRYNLIITNGGNVPISMKTTKFDVFLNGIKIELGKSEEIPLMLLYPKDKTDFSSAEVFFAERKPVPFGMLKEATLRLDFEIEYNDVGSVNIKKIDRSVSAVLNTYPAEVQLLRIDDTI